ncbi:Bug family tripartite tricarboxylate transporter substrate binding protein [Hydrogenophaga crocea]|uniref:Tripartite tricarboxylate transporter substrate binding protein n=1 Tax=Hydrogenophaga crocea TaxID=2716225 RepID=A0A6G8IGI1_9BURK|nr:tripartite tricarboxylate transporter substrate binding protein [Hydrogenophaga crocea]QIM52297.1 tripartite tricarboxylate transporter substrate binding protein [Hydrogenophaga crocea]
MNLPPARRALRPGAPTTTPRRRLLAALGAALLGAGVGPARAASGWPDKPVRIIVPFGAGGSTDALARIVGSKLSEAIGQPVVIDNRAGAAGAIGAQAVARAPADGHTLLLATSSTHAVLPHLRSLPYDAVKDFTPIARIASAPNVLVVSPGLKVTSVKELVQIAAAREGGLSYSSSGNGTVTHLIAADFVQRAGLRARHVPYKTGIQALPELNSGQIDFAFDSIVWTLPQAQAGKLRAIAIGSAERSPLAPDLPTLREAGFSGFDGTTWFALMGPAGLPATVVAELSRHLNAVLRDPDLRAQFERQGAEPLGGTPQALERLVQDDGKRWAGVIAAGGIKMDQ